MTTPRDTLRDLHIRWMIRRDMAEVLAIDRLVCQTPWSKAEFVRCLRQRGCLGKVALDGERVVGFVIYELDLAELRLRRLGVEAERRRRGIGSALWRNLAARLSPEGRGKLTARCPEDALGAQLFFAAQGAVAAGIVDGEIEFVYRCGWPVGVEACGCERNTQ